MVCLNIVVGILPVISDSPFEDNGDTTRFTKVTNTILAAVLMLSGVILIRAVMKIRMTFAQQHSETNTKVMVLHSVSVGVFLFSLTLYTVIILKNDNTKRLRIAESVSDLCAWVSEILLGFILLQMCLPDEEEKDDRDGSLLDSTIITVYEADFDEDAELQAKIWNLFAKKRTGLLGSNVKDQAPQDSKESTVEVGDSIIKSSLLSSA